MECNSELYCTMDPLVLSSCRQQLNQGMEKGMNSSLLKAGCWWILKEKLLQFYKVIFVFPLHVV